MDASVVGDTIRVVSKRTGFLALFANLADGTDLAEAVRHSLRNPTVDPHPLGKVAGVEGSR